MEHNTREKMKRLVFVLTVLSIITFSYCQTREKYLVFTFISTFHIQDYIHGTGENLWIISYDSCKTGIKEKDLKPLFVDDFQIEALAEPDFYLGYFTVDDYSNAPELLECRKVIQKRITNFTYKNAVEKLTIYLVPIIAKCSSHPFGYYQTPVVTIDSDLEIWNDFWDKTENEVLRYILMHDFSKFNFRATFSKW